MYQQMNDQLAASSRQYAETAAQINRIALQNLEHIFGLQLATMEENMSATFAFWNQLLDVRDLGTLRQAMPNGLQVARENLERAVVTGQEAYESTVKSNETIGQIAKGQFEQVARKAEQATRQAGNRARAAR